MSSSAPSHSSRVPHLCPAGHYDVQPAMEREWATDPFEMQAIDGYFYGRGTSDNKVRPGPSVLRLALLHAATVLGRSAANGGLLARGLLHSQAAGSFRGHT